MVAEVLDERQNVDAAAVAHAVLSEALAAGVSAACPAQDGHERAGSKARGHHLALAAGGDHNQAGEHQLAKHGRAVATVQQHECRFSPARAQQRRKPCRAQPGTAAAEAQQSRRLVFTGRAAVAAECHE